jgi:HK97 gp10 family phage protein
MSEVNVKGLRELQAFLDQLPAKMESNIMRGALRAGAKPIRIDAQRNLQTNGSVETGELVKGIKVTTRSRKGVVTATIKTAGKHGYIANWIEHGTAAHWIKPKNARSLFFAGLFAEVIEHPGARAKPFMRPAMDNRQQDAVIAVGNYIKARLTKAGIEGAGDVEVGAA